MISKKDIIDGGDLLHEMLESSGKYSLKLFEVQYVKLEVIKKLRQELKKFVNGFIEPRNPYLSGQTQRSYIAIRDKIDEVFGVEEEK